MVETTSGVSRRRAALKGAGAAGAGVILISERQHRVYRRQPQSETTVGPKSARRRVIAKKLVIALLSAVALTVPVPAAANRPVEEPIYFVFSDINPCTGEEVTVTFVGSALVHEHRDRVIATLHRTVTTSDGFEGRGVESFVYNGQMFKSTQNDIFTNVETGQRFRGQFVFVVDLATDTVRVERSPLTCVGP